MVEALALFIVVPIILVLIVIVVVVVLVLRSLFHGRKPSLKTESTMDEARMVQELYRGMQRMEQRIESLEALLREHDPS